MKGKGVVPIIPPRRAADAQLRVRATPPHVTTFNAETAERAETNRFSLRVQRVLRRSSWLERPSRPLRSKAASVLSDTLLTALELWPSRIRYSRTRASGL